MRRKSLVLRFALLSLAVIVVLGVVLSESSARATARRSLDSARDSAVLVSRLGIQPQLTPGGLARGLGPTEVANLDRVLRSDEGTASIARIKIWNRSGQVVYSDDRSLIGRRFTPDDGLLEALDGHVESEISTLGRAENASERRFGKLFEVYVPIRFVGASRPGARSSSTCRTHRSAGRSRRTTASATSCSRVASPCSGWCSFPWSGKRRGGCGGPRRPTTTRPCTTR